MHSNVTYRQVRAGTTLDRAIRLAADMEKKNHLALTIDFERSPMLNTENAHFLRHFPRINHLTLINAKLETIDGFSFLEDLLWLNLSHVVLEDWSCLAQLKNLQVLSVFGSPSNVLDPVASLNQLRALAFIKVLDCFNLNSLSYLYNLEWLRLESCTGCAEIPELSRCRRLRRVVLEQMHELKTLEEFVTAPNIREFVVMGANRLGVTDFEQLRNCKALEAVFPAIAHETSKVFHEIATLFPNRVMTGYYGTPNQFYSLRYGTNDEWVARLR